MSKLNLYEYFKGQRGRVDDFQSTPGLNYVVDDDIIRELYSKEGHPRNRVQFSNIYQTMRGPVIGVTIIEPPTQGRTTPVNRSMFVKVSEVVEELFRQLEKPPVFPLQVKNAKII